MKLLQTMVGMLVLAVVVGCGGGEFRTAAVRGKVVKDGQPVAGGGVTFRPVAAPGAADAGKKAALVGKPASGEIQQDGTFTLTTYKKGDGAVVGKHEVTFTAPPAPAAKAGEKPQKSPYEGMVPKEPKVDIKAGSNDVTIELVPKT